MPPGIKRIRGVISGWAEGLSGRAGHGFQSPVRALDAAKVTASSCSTPPSCPLFQLCLPSALRARYSIIGALRHSGSRNRQKVIYYAHSVTRAHAVIYRGAGILWFKGRRLVLTPNYYRTFGKRTPTLRSASLF